MESTHVFKLPCGVEAEVSDMDGSHQRLLTEKSKGKTFTDRLDELLADLVIRIGGVKNPSKAFFKKMLNCDKAKLLVEIRQFSQEHDPFFVFTWRYKSEKDDRYHKYTHEEELPEGVFPSLTVKVDNPEFNKKEEESEDNPAVLDANYIEYSEVLEDKDRFTILPRSGTKVRWTMLDGAAVARGAATKKKDLSSHTQIKLRNPVKFTMGGADNKKEIAVSLNLDKLKLKDIEHLRKEIQKYEGKVYTEIIFEHPEADYKGPNNKDVVVDVLGSSAFFFPSEAL